MKMPEKPRPFTELFQKAIKVDLITGQKDMQLVKQYNEEYIHWDELRRKDLNLDPETIWAFMKLSRISTSKHVAISDISLTYNITNQAQRIMHLLDTGASGLLVLNEQLKTPEMERYVISSLMEEAIASSQLEGAVTTTKMAKRMLRENRKPKTNSEQMIVNDYVTMNRMKELRDQPLTVASILELHKLLTNVTLDDPAFEGRFRIDNETIVGDPLESEKIYHHPPSFDKIQIYMETLCEFANSDSGENFQHPLVKAIIIHFLIGYIHPFIDGNGRLARALMYWYALKNNYWLFEYMAISKVIKESKGKYGMSYLYAETDDNAITYFVNYNLISMEKALENTRQYIRRKQDEQKDAIRLVKTHPELNFRQAEILKDFLKRKGDPISTAEIASKFNVVRQTAKTDLVLLESLGLIEKQRIGRTTYFVYSGNSNNKEKNKVPEISENGG